MLKSIEIKGFKSIDDKIINLDRLSILSGLNSSGKSSLIQALRMCLSNGSKDAMLIDELGEYDEIKSIYTPPNDKVSFNIISERGRVELEIDSNNICHFRKDFDLYLEYIAADRYGPKTNHPIIKGNNFTVGSKGEYVADYFDKFQDVIVHELLRHPEASGNTLKHQLPYWMNEVCPGVSFVFAVDRKHDISHIEINNYRATNTGFGISYSLPIVMTLLTLSSELPKIEFGRPQYEEWHNGVRTNGAIILIENPEAHLHPKGQTYMGYLAALASATGLQIIIETHSDHFIDGVRISAKDEESINNENIIINFFERTGKESTVIKEIRIGENGKLDQWPKGFFDQVSINLRKLNRKG